MRQVRFQKMNAVRNCSESFGKVSSHCECTVVCIFVPCDTFWVFHCHTGREVTFTQIFCMPWCSPTNMKI